jgi:hypothetical protein
MSERQMSLTVAAIESACNGRWGVWLSDTGMWWATRTQAITSEELTSGCVPHVHADNPHELAERIRQQDELRNPDDNVR